MMTADLCTRINRLLQGFPYAAGVVINSPEGEPYCSYNEHQRFPAASLIKLAILLEYYASVEQGLLDPLQQIAIDPDQIVGGTGILQALSPGCQMTLQDLATLMIIVSDNSATNILIDRLTIPKINKTIKSFDLSYTILKRRMLDWEARENGFENMTSAADMANLLQIFLTSERLSESSKAGIFEILSKQCFQHKLPAQTPAHAMWAHKTGQLPDVEHDAGILQVDEKRVIVVVLTAAPETSNEGVRLIGDIGRIAFLAAQ